MKGAWLHKKERKSLILFCNGWGMDGNPFRSLAAVQFDVYMLYDYRQLSMPAEVDRMFEKYNDIHLIGWSMGVWVGQRLFADKRERLSGSLAVNGTLCPIDDRYGIPKDIFAETLTTFNEAARSRFYRRMCREKSNLRSFLARQPVRTIDDQKEELAALRDMADCIEVDEAIYRQIIVAEYDWIIPTENQKNYWQGRRVVSVAGFHYLFNLWQSWDHLLSFTDLLPHGPEHPGTAF